MIGCKSKQVTFANLSFRYRSIDGTCNNLVHTSWGATNRAFRRIFPAEYPDGLPEYSCLLLMIFPPRKGQLQR